MSGKLYEKCDLCGGWGVLVSVPGTPSCHCCRGVGYLETGLTVRQVERLVFEERIRLGDPAALEQRRREYEVVGLPVPHAYRPGLPGGADCCGG